MPIPTEPLVWEQGADLTVSMIYRKGATEETATPVDLTGFSLRMDINKSDGTRIFTFNSDDIPETGVDEPGAADNEATLGADGSIKILVPRAITLPGGIVYNTMQGPSGESIFNYDIFLRDNQAPPKQKKILQGQITINKSVTLWV